MEDLDERSVAVCCYNEETLVSEEKANGPVILVPAATLITAEVVWTHSEQYLLHLVLLEDPS